MWQVKCEIYKLPYSSRRRSRSGAFSAPLSKFPLELSNRRQPSGGLPCCRRRPSSVTVYLVLLQPRLEYEVFKLRNGKEFNFFKQKISFHRSCLLSFRKNFIDRPGPPHRQYRLYKLWALHVYKYVSIVCK